MYEPHTNRANQQLNHKRLNTQSSQFNIRFSSYNNGLFYKDLNVKKNLISKRNYHLRQKRIMYFLACLETHIISKFVSHPPLPSVSNLWPQNFRVFFPFAPQSSKRHLKRIGIPTFLPNI